MHPGLVSVYAEMVEGPRVFWLFIWMAVFLVAVMFWMTHADRFAGKWDGFWAGLVCGAGATALVLVALLPILLQGVPHA